MKTRHSLLIVLAQLATLSAYAGPIEDLKPGEWYEVPNSRMNGVKPASIPSGHGSNNAVISAWNGGAFDTKRNRLIIWGGGHSDYSGNEIYVFDLGTLRWKRLTEPSINPVSTSASPDPDGQDPYPDGTPNPRHTYATSVYIPTIDRYWVAGGSTWRSGPCTAKVWTYDFNANPPQSGWSQQVSDYHGAAVGGDCGALAAYDPVRDSVFLLTKSSAGDGLYEFDPKNPDSPWTLRNGNTARDLYMTGAIDPGRRKFVAVGGTAYGGAAKTWMFDIDKRGAPRTTLSTTGAREIESANAPGLAYDPVSDRMVAWDGGANVYTLNLDTRVWTRIAPAATNKVTPPPVTASGGTFNRFQYVPSKNVFVVVNSAAQNVFIYRLSDGGGARAAN
jgi:hypothetical protein